jgi:hypothetical protein
MSDSSKPVTVTGPDCDRRAESAGVGLSYAVTCASRASRAGMDASYYVRDEAGDVVGRADTDGSGGVRVFGEGALAAYRVNQLPPPEREIDRASARGDAASARADGRPGSSRRPTKEEKMAQAKDSTLDGDLTSEVKRVSAKQAAAAVLKRAGEPLKADEIARRVLKMKGVSLQGKTPEATIAAMLSVENKKPDGMFVRTDKATYRLREQAPQKRSRSTSKAKAQEQVEA